MPATTRPHAPHPSAPGFRDAQAVADLFLNFFRRDLLAFFPQSRFEPRAGNTAVADAGDPRLGPDFRLLESDDPSGVLRVDLFGDRYALTPRPGGRFSAQDRRLVRAVGAVLSMRYFHLFQTAHSSRLELFRGGSEDHYVAAYIEPGAYSFEPGARPSRVASAIQTLRTAALSTYENRRVSTGALLLGPAPDPDHPARPTSSDALDYGVELTSLKSIHRLCDGRRTLFLVDRDGKLCEIIDVESWAARSSGGASEAGPPCARAYTAHARATRSCGHVCVVLSPNQEIKLFAEGVQVFAFAHGRWRVLDPAAKYAAWASAVANERVARVIYQTALDLGESRQGGLFVVIDDPATAAGRLIAGHDLLDSDDAACGPPTDLLPGDPLAKRALQYLARGRNLADLDPPVLEALAGLDGAVAADRSGRLLAFGAILRHDATQLPRQVSIGAEGARTTAALVASRFGPVLKVSEDGVVTCFLDGARAWDL